MYILQISNKAFIKRRHGEVVLTPDPKEAETFEKIGDAMGTAAVINDTLGNFSTKLIPVPDNL